jgi:hypothetical protein
MIFNLNYNKIKKYMDNNAKRYDRDFAPKRVDKMHLKHSNSARTNKNTPGNIAA